MKKLMLIGMMIGLGSMLIGCDYNIPSSKNVSNTSENVSNTSKNVSNKNDTWMSHGQLMATKIVEIEGHKYIIMSGFKCGSIIHAESCSCKK